MRVGDPEGKQVKDRRFGVHIWGQVQDLGLRPDRLVPLKTNHSIANDKQELKCENRVEHVVHHIHDSGNLLRGLFRILHNFSLTSNVYN